MELEFLVYGTRTSKDKSGAYLFLPDSEAKVPERPHRILWLLCVGRAWEGPGILGLTLLSLWRLVGCGLSDVFGPAQARALGQGFLLTSPGLLLLLCTLCYGFSGHLLFFQPYVPKRPPVLRVTEGPFFSEVAVYYEHFHQVIRLYNLPGEPCGWGRSHRLAPTSPPPPLTSGYVI